MSSDTGHPTHLASVLDLYEMNLVTALFYNEEVDYNPQQTRAYAWVGLSVYKTSDQKTLKYSWTDGYPYIFSKWAKGEPAVSSIQVEPAKSCVYIDEGKCTGFNYSAIRVLRLAHCQNSELCLNPCQVLIPFA